MTSHAKGGRGKHFWDTVWQEGEGFLFFIFLFSTGPSLGLLPVLGPRNNLLNEKVDDLDHQATTAGLGKGVLFSVFFCVKNRIESYNAMHHPCTDAMHGPACLSSQTQF